MTKKVINNDGGSAVAGDWTTDIIGDNVSSTAFDGVENPGVTVNLYPGVYNVSQSGGPSGYDLKLSADCSGTIGLGDDLTCTITNDDIDPRLPVIIQVVNDNGSAVASDWTMDITGANLSSTGFAGAESGVTITLDPGAYSVTESGGPSGDTMTFSDDCSGDIGLGDDLTCTVTNDDESSVIVPAANALPRASITSPAGGSTFTTDFSIPFVGSGDDVEDGVLTAESLVWRSSIEGEIGTGQSFSRTVGAGSHTITMTATDGEGASASTSVAITIEIPATPGAKPVVLAASHSLRRRLRHPGRRSSQLPFRNRRPHPCRRRPGPRPRLLLSRRPRRRRQSLPLPRSRLLPLCQTRR